MLRTARRGMKRYIDQWELALNGTYEGVAWDAEVSDYQGWKDKYDIYYSGAVAVIPATGLIGSVGPKVA